MLISDNTESSKPQRPSLLCWSGEKLRDHEKVRYLIKSWGRKCLETTVAQQVFSFPREYLLEMIPRPEVISSLEPGPVDWSLLEEDQMECDHLH